MVHIVSFDEDDLVGSYSASPSSSIKSPSSSSLTSFDLSVQPNLSDQGLATLQQKVENNISVMSTSCPPNTGFDLDLQKDNPSSGSMEETKGSALPETSGLMNSQYYGNNGAATSAKLLTANVTSHPQVSTFELATNTDKRNLSEEVSSVPENIKNWSKDEDLNKEDTHSVNSKGESDSKTPPLDSNELARLVDVSSSQLHLIYCDKYGCQ